MKTLISFLIPFLLFPQQKQPSLDESFNPSELQEPKLELPPIILPGDDLSGKELEEDFPSDSTRDGYRVQVLSTRDHEEADTLQAQLMERFPGEVYVTYDPPIYKVRVGNFINRPLAEEAQTRLKRMGFRRAWVIRTRVLMITQTQEQSTSTIEK
ncbi:MAG: SPOR domain-containing protein [Fidelibacterota bacterium]